MGSDHRLGRGLVWGVPGLIRNPDVAIGEAAGSKVVLGVDMNGWHAVFGFPHRPAGFRRRDAAHLGRRVLPLLPWGSLIATAIWALADAYPVGGLFYFPDAGADAVLRLATAAVFVVGAPDYLVTRGRDVSPTP